MSMLNKICLDQCIVPTNIFDVVSRLWPRGIYELESDQKKTKQVNLINCIVPGSTMTFPFGMCPRKPSRWFVTSGLWKSNQFDKEQEHERSEDRLKISEQAGSVMKSFDSRYGRSYFRFFQTQPLSVYSCVLTCNMKHKPFARSSCRTVPV